MPRNYLRLGSWNALCDVCGFKFKSEQLRKRWDGLMVCGEDFELRHMQDFVQTPIERIAPPWVRPDGDIFLPACTPNGQSAVPGHIEPGCVYPGYLSPAYDPTITPLPPVVVPPEPEPPPPVWEYWLTDVESYTYTLPRTAVNLKVTVYAGGGAGGPSNSGDQIGGGGGGSGAIASATLGPVSSGAEFYCMLNNNGGLGGASASIDYNFDSLLSVGGGYPGGPFGAGGAGGTVLVGTPVRVGVAGPSTVTNRGASGASGVAANGTTVSGTALGGAPSRAPEVGYVYCGGGGGGDWLSGYAAGAAGANSWAHFEDLG
jgi:hypothetical protein